MDGLGHRLQGQGDQVAAWIAGCRSLKTGLVSAILEVISEDHQDLRRLEIQMAGVNSARTDIINGGPDWWRENHRGISNIFSAISLTPRNVTRKGDIFKGLLGVFNGLFAADEVQSELPGDDMETISFAFFKRLSIRTGRAWTRLATSNRERGEWDWIPVVENSNRPVTTDCFAGVVELGRLKQKGFAKTMAETGINGVPQKYMKIKLTEGPGGFDFVFKGCNCGKKVKTAMFKKEVIPTANTPKVVAKDETGRTLVQCATILGRVMDPDPTRNVVEYRRRLLNNLQPYWPISDPSAKPENWIDRCVSGSFLGNPNPEYFRTHNMSVNYSMPHIIGCGTRLQNKRTATISCEVTVDCGCVITGPASLIFEALMAVEGSSLGESPAFLDKDHRIVLQDGLGLVQVGDVGKTYSLVTFEAGISSYRSHAKSCRSTKKSKPVQTVLQWPKGRALVRDEFNHGFTDAMRDYGYVDMGGSGNLLVCRNHLMGDYKVVGVCIDEVISHKKAHQKISIR